jgi:RHS repeat-associated protein
MPASANTGTWGTAPQWKRDHAGQSGATNPQGDASTNGVEHYYHVDHLGTSQRLTNAQGETTWRMVSEAFGKTFVDTTLAPTTTGTTTNNLRFPGQYEDQETGTYYNWNRDYSPSVGRYLQRDFGGFQSDPQPYVYAAAAPLFITDPDGDIIQLPALLCIRFPRICAELLRCISRPEACKKKLCKFGNTLYQGCKSLNAFQCKPCGESCAASTGKLVALETCYVLRLAMSRCYPATDDRSPNAGHEAQLAPLIRMRAVCFEAMSVNCNSCPCGGF